MNFSGLSLAIVGAGGHGIVVADAALMSGRWDSITFYDDKAHCASASKYDMPWPLGGDFWHLLSNCGLYDGVVVGVGNNCQRLMMSKVLVEAGANLVSIVHPSAIVSKYSTVEKGSVLLAGVIVNYGVKIGESCILNTGSQVDHHCIIGSGVHISPGVTVAGRVAIGTKSWIGIGSSIKDGLVIGENVIVGAGAVVIRDVADETTVVGVPASRLSRS